MIWWVLKKVFGLERPEYYLGSMTNLEIDEEVERRAKESYAE
jgi:hypothetical protein